MCPPLLLSSCVAVSPEVSGVSIRPDSSVHSNTTSCRLPQWAPIMCWIQCSCVYSSLDQTGQLVVCEGECVCTCECVYVCVCVMAAVWCLCCSSQDQYWEVCSQEDECSNSNRCGSEYTSQLLLIIFQCLTVIMCWIKHNFVIYFNPLVTQLFCQNWPAWNCQFLVQVPTACSMLTVSN